MTAYKNCAETVRLRGEVGDDRGKVIEWDAVSVWTNGFISSRVVTNAVEVSVLVRLRNPIEGEPVE